MVLSSSFHQNSRPVLKSLVNSYHIYPDLALDSGCAFFFKSNLFKNPEYVTVSSTELPPIVSVRTVTWIPSSLPSCGVTYLEVWQNKLFALYFEARLSSGISQTASHCSVEAESGRT